MTKKIGILTFHRAENYGAVLQAYALLHFLSGRKEAQVQVLDLRVRSIDKRYSLFYSGNGSFRSRRRTFAASLFKLPQRIGKKRAFRKFRKEELRLSRKLTRETIQDAAKEYDSIITGSDQVFNRQITGEDADIFYLSFVPEGTKKYSYAASFGVNDPADEELFRRYLPAFDGLSLREAPAAERLAQLCDQRTEVHVDPVFLLERQEWDAFAETKVRAPGASFGNYLLLYDMAPSEALYRAAETIADGKGLKVVCIGNRWRHLRKRYSAFSYIDSASVHEFVRLFRDADCVVTSSFHGTAFSCIFGRPFLVILPENYDRSQRIEELLHSFGLEERLLFSYEGQRPEETDRKKITAVIEAKRKEAEAYLARI